MTALAADDPPVASQTLQSPLTGPRPCVVVLCRFADDPSTPADPSYYRTLYQDTYPGISHYWREVSYGSLSMAASVVLGWYNLAKPRIQYLSNGMIQFALLAQDCAARAQNDVQFPNYRGISVVMNGLVVTSGIESLSLTLNGTTRNYGVSEFNAGSSQNHLGRLRGLGRRQRARRDAAGTDALGDSPRSGPDLREPGRPHRHQRRELPVQRDPGNLGDSDGTPRSGRRVLGLERMPLAGGNHLHRRRRHQPLDQRQVHGHVSRRRSMHERLHGGVHRRRHHDQQMPSPLHGSMHHLPVDSAARRRQGPGPAGTLPSISTCMFELFSRGFAVVTERGRPPFLSIC